MRWAAAAAIAAVLLAGCGTQSATSAVKGWMSASNYNENLQTLVGDVKSTQSALNSASTPAIDFHTVCSVLDDDTRAANSSLPTPDSQATALLGTAYDTIGNGANACYFAAGEATMRASALRFLATGLEQLNAATLRLQVASG